MAYNKHTGADGPKNTLGRGPRKPFSLSLETCMPKKFKHMSLNILSQSVFEHSLEAQSELYFLMGL